MMVSGTEPNGRQADGRFANGNAGGPGRPRRPVEEDYLRVLNESVSVQDWAQVVRRAVEDAKQGDARARDWLSKHILEGVADPLFRLALAEQRGDTYGAKIERATAREGANAFRPGVH